MTHLFSIFCTIPLVLTPLSANDWRIDLLSESGMGTSEADLKRSFDTKEQQEKLEAAFKQLGSRSFQEREEAQKFLIAGGASTLEFLRNKQTIESAEARLRTIEIRPALASGLIGGQDMIAVARSSLLKERDADDTGGIFYEWFGTDANDCDAGYRSFVFQAADRKSARVDQGQLRLLGNRQGDVDQQMILKAKGWPKSDKLPDRFSVTARLGGGAAGSGTYHVGISIGRVKALFHPGYEGGAFRFEQVGTFENLTQNKNMGFTPGNEQLYPMTVLVERRKNQVKLTATIKPKDRPAFAQSIELDIGQFGEFDQISLDRSGRPGGDGIFDDLFVDLDPG